MNPVILTFYIKLQKTELGHFCVEKSRSIITLNAASVSFTEVEGHSSNAAVVPCSCEGIHYACGQIYYRPNQQNIFGTQ